MHKDYTQKILIEMDEEKQLWVLYKLANFIQVEGHDYDGSHFNKLNKYHSYLKESQHLRIQKINKEFIKIKSIDYQFEVYLMNLERFLGQSKKEYDFIVSTGDNTNPVKNFNIICALDSVRSAHNVGSFFRNTECFGGESLILGGLTPTPELAQVQKTSMGCEKIVNWKHVKDLTGELIKLKESGYKIWSIETSKVAIHLNDLNHVPEKVILIFGHEQHGISKELIDLSDKILDISLFGSKNSLNVATSQAITLNKLTSLL
jgi:tRNA G18 (ribose-2'-O)-methylase SpoU